MLGRGDEFALVTGVIFNIESKGSNTISISEA
jgi:hypothetical protein